MTEMLMPEVGHEWLDWAKTYLPIVPSTLEINVEEVLATTMTAGLAGLPASRPISCDDRLFYPVEALTHPCHVYRYLVLADKGGDEQLALAGEGKGSFSTQSTMSEQIRDHIYGLFKSSDAWMDTPALTEPCFHHPLPFYTQSPCVINAIYHNGQQYVLGKPVQLLVYYSPNISDEWSLPYQLSHDAIKAELWLTGFTEAWVWYCSLKEGSLDAMSFFVEHRWVTLSHEDVEGFNRRAASLLAIPDTEPSVASMNGSAQRVECCQCPYFNRQCFPASGRIC